MKVIYLHQYFNTPKKTGGVRSYDIAKHLINKGHTVEMVTTNTSLSNSSGWETSTEDPRSDAQKNLELIEDILYNRV